MKNYFAGSTNRVVWRIGKRLHLMPQVLQVGKDGQEVGSGVQVFEPRKAEQCEQKVFVNIE